MNNRDVYILFKDVRCPGCGEAIQMDQFNFAFRFDEFKIDCNNDNEDCKAFTQDMNQLVSQLRSDALSPENLSLCLAQYSNKLH